MADVVQVRDVGPFLPQESINSSGGFDGIEQPQTKLHLLPQRDIGAIVINLLDEKVGLLTLFISWVLGGEDDNGVSFVAKKALQLEETSLRPPERKIELIYQQNLQTSTLLGAPIHKSGHVFF